MDAKDINLNVQMDIVLTKDYVVTVNTIAQMHQMNLIVQV